MTWFLLIGGLALCLMASAMYSGSETGFYSLSRVQLDVEAERGRRSARWARRLSRDDAGLLIVILIGNTLAIELATHFGERIGEHLGATPSAAALAVSFWLTPIAFFVAELLPKEMFRRRPHGLLPFALPILALSRVIFWPLERVLRGITWLVERVLGVDDNTSAILHGREGWQARFEEGHRAGALPDRTFSLMRNAMNLRTTPIGKAMVPWGEVVKLSLGDPFEVRLQQLRGSRFSRLPVVDGKGSVRGYLHQLDSMAREAGQDRPGGLKALERPQSEPGKVAFVDWLADPLDVPVLDPDLSVSQALMTLKGLGKRAAVVGTLAAPQGWITLKDLVEELTGDLVGL